MGICGEYMSKLRAVESDITSSPTFLPSYETGSRFSLLLEVSLGINGVLLEKVWKKGNRAYSL